MARSTSVAAAGTAPGSRRWEVAGSFSAFAGASRSIAEVWVSSHGGAKRRLPRYLSCPRYGGTHPGNRDSMMATRGLAVPGSGVRQRGRGCGWHASRVGHTEGRCWRLAIQRPGGTGAPADRPPGHPLRVSGQGRGDVSRRHRPHGRRGDGPAFSGPAGWCIARTPTAVTLDVLVYMPDGLSTMR